MTKTVKLGEIINSPISGEWGEEGSRIKVLRSTNFTNEGFLDLSDVVTREIPEKKIQQKRLVPGDIIIEKSGGSPNQPVGRVVYFDLPDEEFLFSNFTSVLRPKPGIHPRFLFWFLFGNHLNKQTLAFQNKTTGIINLQLQRYIDETLVPLPSLPEQRRIAALLDRADALRQKDRQLLSHYDRLAQSVFLDLFWKADQTGWPVLTIEELSNGKGSMRTGPFGSDLLHSEFVDEGVFVLGIDNVVNNRFEWAKTRFITHAKYQKLKRYTVYPGDVLITIMGTTGRTAVVPDNLPEAINSKHLAAITLNQRKADPTFISFSFQFNPSVRHQLASQTKGAIMDGLNLGIIKTLKIPVPPLSLQTHFARIIEGIERQKALVRAQMAQSEALFGRLLQDSFGG